MGDKTKEIFKSEITEKYGRENIMIVENIKMRSALLLLKRKATAQMTPTKNTCFLTEDDINDVLCVADMEIEPLKDLEVINAKKL